MDGATIDLFDNGTRGLAAAHSALEKINARQKKFGQKLSQNASLRTLEILKGIVQKEMCVRRTGSSEQRVLDEIEFRPRADLHALRSEWQDWICNKRSFRL